MCELLFCIFCMGLFSSQSDAQTVPKKKGVLRSLSNSLPYGYTQLGNSTLYYKQNSESIDLIGQFSELLTMPKFTSQILLLFSKVLHILENLLLKNFTGLKVVS